MVDDAITASLCLAVPALIVIGLGLSTLGVGFFCWLLFTLAHAALPVFAGLTAALIALNLGSGPFGAVNASVEVGVAFLAFGRFGSRLFRLPF